MGGYVQLLLGDPFQELPDSWSHINLFEIEMLQSRCRRTIIQIDRTQQLSANRNDVANITIWPDLLAYDFDCLCVLVGPPPKAVVGSNGPFLIDLQLLVEQSFNGLLACIHFASRSSPNIYF